MADLDRYRIPWEKTCWSCSIESFDFRCTDELSPLDHFIGQRRALEALRFGLEVDKPGYNLFVTGLSGTGKTSAIKSHLQRVVEELGEQNGGKSLHDWCYVYNFDDSDWPTALRLPRGMGKALRFHLSNVLRRLREELPAVFQGEDYQNQRRELEESGRQSGQQIMTALEQAAREANFAIQGSQMGLTIFPMRDNRPMTGEEYQQLPPEQKQAIDETRNQLLRQTEDIMSQMRDIERETMDKVKALEQVAAGHTVSEIFRETLDTFRDIAEIHEFLHRLIDYILDNLNLFQEPEGQQPQGQSFPGGMPQPPVNAPSALSRNPFLPFEANVLVDNSEVYTLPVIIEANPNWGNMFGRIERRAMFGTYVSDHTMLKAGAVHLANGGYLVLNARDLFMYPGVWEGLKRVLRNREICLEDPAEQAGFFVPQGLRPEAVPLDLKVIISGDEQIYRVLTSVDYEDFWELFKVKAEFDHRIDQTEENINAYCSFVCRTTEEERLLPFEVSGLVRVLEFAAREVSDQRRFTSRFGHIKDLLIEADYWARKDSSKEVESRHVRKALEHKYYRLNLIEERIKELIAEGTLLVDVDGAKVGQINGLSVYDLGDFSFGRPSRITAQTFAGRNGVVNIERESALSGRIHDKGVLILSGYLGAKYGQKRPLSLAASICFEQSYDGIEGDSASSTELYVILSSLSGLPVRQDIAVTGSVSQKGEIQPIGGVNEKIEGMYDVCRARGLTGNQGVMIPARNQHNLMLREDVVEAIKTGQFHVYAINTIDEGLEILTGHAAGEMDEQGNYPPSTVNYLVEERLEELSQSLRGLYSELIHPSP